MVNKHNNLSGAQYFFTGITDCFSSRYRKYLILPILVDIILWVFLWSVGYHYFSHFIVWINNFLPSWLQWLDFLFWVSYFLAFVILGGYLFTIMATIILAPFLSFLAESVQRDYSDKNIIEIPWSKCVQVIIKSVFRQLRILSYSLPRIIILGILFFIPVVNIITGILWFLFGAWIHALEYLDFASEQNNQSFSDQLKFMRKNRFDVLIFGCVLMLFTMIPILNILVAPAATIGATKLFLDKNN